MTNFEQTLRHQGLDVLEYEIEAIVRLHEEEMVTIRAKHATTTHLLDGAIARATRLVMPQKNGRCDAQRGVGYLVNRQRSAHPIARLRGTRCKDH